MHNYNMEVSPSIIGSIVSSLSSITNGNVIVTSLDNLKLHGNQIEELLDH